MSDATSQHPMVIAKDLVIAAITSPNKQISLFSDPTKAAQQIAEMYKTIYAVVSK